MEISIDERLKPFSHWPGTYTLLPGSGWPIMVFPALIRIYRFQGSAPIQLAELSLEVKGPVEQFTVFNDLERGCLTVTGLTREGWMHYRLVSSQSHNDIRLFVVRAPERGLRIQKERQQVLLRDEEWMPIMQESAVFEPYSMPLYDRLSFGSHKGQDWELIKRRGCLGEIFPFWHRLGQLIPQSSLPSHSLGNLSLLEECGRSFDQGNPEMAQECWKNFFMSGFTGFLVPQLEDHLHQGIVKSIAKPQIDGSPLVILSEGARLIRKLLLQQTQGFISILPFLLPCLPCGRLINTPLEGGGAISIEWTKKTIRRMVIFSEQESELSLKFRSNIGSYRLRSHLREKGERKTRSATLILKKNCRYFIDNFN